MSAPEASPERRFIGAAMIAVGGLIAALCGSCTLIFSVAMIAQSLDSLRDAAQMLPVFLLFGGPPTLLGALIFAWGRGLRRPPKPRRPRPLTLFSDETDRTP